jgi:hypothetical protein
MDIGRLLHFPEWIRWRGRPQIEHVTTQKIRKQGCWEANAKCVPLR